MEDRIEESDRSRRGIERLNRNFRRKKMKFRERERGREKLREENRRERKGEED